MRCVGRRFRSVRDEIQGQGRGFCQSSPGFQRRRNRPDQQAARSPGECAERFRHCFGPAAEKTSRPALRSCPAPGVGAQSRPTSGTLIGNHGSGGITQSSDKAKFMKSVGIGIVGIGFMGMTHFNAVQKLSGAKVVALCSRDPKKLAGDWTGIQGNFGPRGVQMDLSGQAKYPEVDALLADPNVDLVDLCVPNDEHAKLAVRGARGGQACAGREADRAEHRRRRCDGRCGKGVGPVVDGCPGLAVLPRVRLCRRGRAVGKSTEHSRPRTSRG